MALDLSAASLVRAGSGIVFIAAGVLALFLWRGAGERRRMILGLGIVALATGGFLVPRNLSASDPALAVPSFVLIAVFVAAGAVGALLLVFDKQPSRVPRSAALAVAAGSAALYAMMGPLLAERMAIAFRLPPGVVGYEYVGTPLQGLAAAGLGAWALRVAGADPPPRERLLFVVAILGEFAYIAAGCGDALAQPTIVPGEPVIFFAYLFTLTAPTLAGLVFLARGARRAGAILTAGPLSIALFVALSNLVLPPSLMVGIVRSILAGALGYAILKLARPHAVARRGVALAPVGLAVVFIVAQVAQNFFSAEYGLLTGGIVAGAFLFAASPIQRAMERIAEGRAQARGSTGAPASESKREAYRRALRVALRDRVLTPEEEVELAHVAHELGLSAPEAVSLKHEIERAQRAPKEE